MDEIGRLIKFTSFGESHGVGIGGVVSGFPAGVGIDYEFLKQELDRRRGGGVLSTPRKERDDFEIYSGVFQGLSTGAAIGFFIKNENVRSRDYENIKDIYRPGHADFTYMKKYGLRDYFGGGRSSARESVARVLAGGLAKLLLSEFDINIHSLVYAVGSESIDLDDLKDDRGNFKEEIFKSNSLLVDRLQEEILKAKNSGNSVGASALICVKGMKSGLGEPLGYKLDSSLASGLMGLNAVKAVEIGDGVLSAQKTGLENNDFMDEMGFKSNHSGGILGGISNGNDLIIKIHFKPTPSIFLPQETINYDNSPINLRLSGRHDPCVGIRGAVIGESIVALVLADMLMINTSANLHNLKKVYSQ